MSDFNLPRHPVGSPAREEAARLEMRMAMHRILKEAVKAGWLECELTMALADVAEEHVITLADRRPPTLYLVPKESA